MVENISPVQVWEALRSNPDARLVDVRTDAEWNYVGMPDLSAVGQAAGADPLAGLSRHAGQRGFRRADARGRAEARHHVYFLCRSGVRSVAAAEAALTDGFAHVFNIAGGFEGPLDGEGHRGGAAGWKAEGLPWRQK